MKLPIKDRSQYAMETSLMVPVGRLPNGSVVLQEDNDVADYCVIVTPDELREYIATLTRALESL